MAPRIPLRLVFGALAALGASALTAPSRGEGPRVLADLEYGQADGEPLLLDLHLPEAEGPRPVVVWIHGGAWRAGSRKGGPALGLLERGYAVACISYRLSQRARYPAQIEDARAAVRWLRAHAGEHRLDPRRIGAWGASAGGHLAALLGTAGDARDRDGGGAPGPASRVQAVCDWFGPTDFLRMDAAGSDLRHDAADSPESLLLGCPVQECPEKARLANPITYVTADDPPFLIVHGERDRMVPFEQSVLLERALRAAGVEVGFHPLPEAGHGGPAFAAPEVMAMVAEFFDPGLHLREDRDPEAPRGIPQAEGRLAAPVPRRLHRPGRPAAPPGAAGPPALRRRRGARGLSACSGPGGPAGRPPDRGSAASLRARGRAGQPRGRWSPGRRSHRGSR